MYGCAEEEKPSILFTRRESDKRAGVAQGEAVRGLVLDTNVVLDWLVFRDPAVQGLAAAVTAGWLRWWVTPPMRDEFATVASRLEQRRDDIDCERSLTEFDR